ncbi:secretory lipase-domain-containing protein [Xylaria bambusicola]|uniref:secretory lipase-domain-containing protein n=1 Tax=Xylaria bambusicola TaxID=326684 RepID=UPI0020073351|nr:secretory lipase-domain-containing protein [Xylaria bambusicola]KAI0503018.1 secretory lipase-domain-containing protein [Xylaria bambusicola]
MQQLGIIFVLLLLFRGSMGQNHHDKSAIPPSQDPWYTAPADFESASPGTILRIRPDPSNITAIVDAAAAYNILFRSTDTRYRPSWAVTTFIVPKNPLEDRDVAREFGADDGRAALLSFQIPYNAASVDGGPSYLLATNFGLGDLGITPMTSYIADAIGRGWYVTVPDFEGPTAAFGAGPQAGHAVLDGIRAVLSSKEPNGKSEKARYAMWGYSGGSIASTFAAEMQASYAPELDFAGAAIGGIVPDLTEVFRKPVSNVSSVIPAGLLGVTAQYPSAREYLVSQLNPSGPYNATGFLQALNFSALQSIVYFGIQNISEYFVNGLDAIYEAPELVRVFGENEYEGYHGIPQMPLFVYKAIHDDSNGIATSDDLISHYCKVGVNILYHRNTIGGHEDEFINGIPRSFEFLSDVLTGTYAEKYNTTGCTWVDVTINVTAPATSDS